MPSWELVNIKKIKSLGLPLYFEYIKSCIIMLLMLFVTSGDYNIITNLAYGSDCHVIDDPK